MAGGFPVHVRHGPAWNDGTPRPVQSGPWSEAPPHCGGQGPRRQTPTPRPKSLSLVALFHLTAPPIGRAVAARSFRDNGVAQHPTYSEIIASAGSHFNTQIRPRDMESRACRTVLCLLAGGVECTTLPVPDRPGTPLAPHSRRNSCRIIVLRCLRRRQCGRSAVAGPGHPTCFSTIGCPEALQPHRRG